MHVYIHGYVVQSAEYLIDSRLSIKLQINQMYPIP